MVKADATLGILNHYDEAETTAIKLVPQFSMQPGTQFSSASLHPELGIVLDLYQKCEDEPAFDSEFLHSASLLHRKARK